MILKRLDFPIATLGGSHALGERAWLDDLPRAQPFGFGVEDGGITREGVPVLAFRADLRLELSVLDCHLRFLLTLGVLDDIVGPPLTRVAAP